MSAAPVAGVSTGGTSRAPLSGTLKDWGSACADPDQPNPARQAATINAIASTLLIGQLMRASDDLAEEAKLVSIVKNANGASKHFGDLKYWITDSAKTLFVRSQQNADAAKVRLDVDLKAIAPVDPA